MLDERAKKDIKLGAKPLAEAKCDECDDHAFTRWYYDGGIAYTLCEAHNEEMLEQNRINRERLGLVAKEGGR